MTYEQQQFAELCEAADEAIYAVMRHVAKSRELPLPASNMGMFVRHLGDAVGSLAFAAGYIRRKSQDEMLEREIARGKALEEMAK